MDLKKIVSSEQAESLIKQLNSIIVNFNENAKFVELSENGITNKLTYEESKLITKGEIYYLVIPNNYPNKGAIIPVQINGIENLYKLSYLEKYTINCSGLTINFNKLEHWNIVNRPNINYYIDVYTKPVKMIRLIEYSIFSNAGKLLEVEFYKMNK
jgi:hypothetical protein